MEKNTPIFRATKNLLHTVSSLLLVIFILNTILLPVQAVEPTPTPEDIEVNNPNDLLKPGAYDSTKNYQFSIKQEQPIVPIFNDAYNDQVKFYHQQYPNVSKTEIQDVYMNCVVHTQCDIDTVLANRNFQETIGRQVQIAPTTQSFSFNILKAYSSLVESIVHGITGIIGGVFNFLTSPFSHHDTHKGSMKAVTTSTAKSNTFNIFGLQIPKPSFPKISIPNISFPKITIPKVSIPTFNFPKFNFPKINWPTFSLPKISIQNPFTGIQNWVKSEQKKNNVSIPSLSKTEDGKNIEKAFIKAVSKNTNLTDLKDQREYIDQYLKLRESGLTKDDVKDVKNWLSDFALNNKEYLKVHQDKRRFTNAVYVTTLSTETRIQKDNITDLEALAQGSEFMTKYWSNSKDEQVQFERDLTMTYSGIPGNECQMGVWAAGIGNCPSKDESATFYVDTFQAKGLNPIFDDSKYSEGKSNQVHHMIGLGMNFGYTGDNHLLPGYIHKTDNHGIAWGGPTYLSSEGWGMWYETTYQNVKLPESKNGSSSSWEDVLLSIEAVQFGKDLRNGKINLEDISKEIRERFGQKQYDVCKDIVSKIPDSNLYTKSCNDALSKLNK